MLYVGKWPWAGTQEWWIYRNRRDIRTTYSEPINDWIKSNPDSALIRAVPADNTRTDVVRGELKVSGMSLTGTSHEMALTSKSDMAEGRFFSEFEDQRGSKVAVIGYDVADALFPHESPMG